MGRVGKEDLGLVAKVAVGEVRSPLVREKEDGRDSCRRVEKGDVGSHGRHSHVGFGVVGRVREWRGNVEVE